MMVLHMNKKLLLTNNQSISVYYDHNLNCEINYLAITLTYAV